MKASNAAELIELYETCPNCGNRMVGCGEGSIEITENIFKRTCKCGFSIVIESE